MSTEDSGIDLCALIVVEYSCKQKHYHIETLRECIRNNQESLQTILNPSDYIPIAICDNDKYVRQFLDKWIKATHIRGGPDCSGKPASC